MFKVGMIMSLDKKSKQRQQCLAELKRAIETLKSLKYRLPERIIEKAVKGMLPKGALGRSMFKRLKVYKGSNHPHKAQNPELVNF